MNSHYTLIIQWSKEDQCYVVSFPEWGDYCHTHGNTDEEALQNAREVLELMTESAIDDGQPLPHHSLTTGSQSA